MKAMLKKLPKLASLAVAATLSLGASVAQAQDKTITLSLHTRTLTFKGLPYLLDYVLPNVYFHVTTAYAILRHNGLEIGKQDFLGKVA